MMGRWWKVWTGGMHFGDGGNVGYNVLNYKSI